MKKRGAQRKHWAESARVWAWYYEIKKRTDWSDYKLDLEFALRPEDRHPAERTGYKPRVFEYIRENARQPKKKSQYRSIEEIVVAVEADPKFKGTREIYEAEMWDVFQENEVTPACVHARVIRILEANELVRIPISSEKGLRHLESSSGTASVFDLCLSLSLRQTNYFSRLPLAWSLYLLSEPADSGEVRSIAAKIVEERIEWFFLKFFQVPENLKFTSIALDVLKRARLNFSFPQVMGYGQLERESKYVVIPKSLQGVINEEHLLRHLQFS